MNARDGELIDFGCRCEDTCPNPACQMSADLEERDMFRAWQREQVRIDFDAETARLNNDLDQDDQAFESWAAAADYCLDEVRDAV